MERFGDDALGLILKWVDDPNDRKSFSQVCKQWLRVEGLNRLSVRVFEPDLLINFLPRFPNLVSFQSKKVITNANIELVSKTCPKLEVLNLNYSELRCNLDEFDDMPGLDDVNDYGLCAFASACNKLTNVLLRRRCRIGSLGVISLVHFARKLVNLDLGRCNKITDEALQAIGSATSLRVLNLQGCWLITDRGLASLASGSLSRTLKRECGPKVTDTGGVAIAGIQTLKRLNFSWLINLSDATLVALAQNCLNLEAVDLTGCESITGYGIRAFVNHEALKELVLVSCLHFSGEDLEEMVLGCQTLRYIRLDKRRRMWIPNEIQEIISNSLCWLDWT
ncbi:F-box/LRR-repeat protein 4 [Camellia lanceoleosa]|uniref:F-box/LRR-repeat protein 4 n=1 Tax=Camellia lanceoleosa TaxID=1840588 RepID=A0ACC0G445_9ERIC|nr:F-box/LRR-repeat protein 4 [Camellia lanceoleosa]